jgi:hypothetical protein
MIRRQLAEHVTAHDFDLDHLAFEVACADESFTQGASIGYELTTSTRPAGGRAPDLARMELWQIRGDRESPGGNADRAVSSAAPMDGSAAGADS